MHILYWIIQSSVSFYTKLIALVLIELFENWYYINTVLIHLNYSKQTGRRLKEKKWF